MKGFVMETRRVEEYGWKDHAAIVIRNYLLHHASIADTVFQGLPIKRGQLITSYEKLMDETGLTKQRVRGAIKRLIDQHLINTQDAFKLSRSQTPPATCRGLLVTIAEYDFPRDSETNTNMTSNTTSDTSATRTEPADQHLYNNEERSIEEQNKEKKNSFSNSTAVIPPIIPPIIPPKYPTLEEVEAYCLETGQSVEPVYFFYKMEDQGWKDKNGQPVMDWKAMLTSWSVKEDRTITENMIHRFLLRIGVHVKSGGLQFIISEIEKTSSSEVFRKLRFDKDFQEQFKKENQGVG